MRTLIVIAVAMLFSATVANAGGSHRVRGHTTRQGTYVPPHRATNPDHSLLNNWSTKGNINPYTGKPGTQDPYKPRR